MVCYFILRHICMIGSHRPVRRQGRKPGTSSPTRRRLGRGDGRRHVGSCQVQAVLPVGGTGTTGQRYYRPLLPPGTEACAIATGCPGTGLRYYRPQAVLPDTMSGTTGDDRYYRSQVRYYRSCMCLRAPVGPQPMYPPLLTYSPSLSPNYPCLVAGL